MTVNKKAMLYRVWNEFIGWMNIYAVVLLTVLTIRVASAQKRDYTLDDNGQRISKLEGQVDDLKQKASEEGTRAISANVEARLTRVETTQDINKQLLIGISIAVGLMLVETAQRRLSMKEIKRQNVVSS